jgi:hypothetical protein
VIRIWPEGKQNGARRWRGTLIHPKSNRRIHFDSLNSIAEEIKEFLKDLQTSEGETALR